MSSGTDSPQADGASDERAAANLSRMMNEGRSFSGNERHCVFLNTGADSRAAGRFANVSAISGLDFPDDGRAVAVVDWDDDGHQDFWISNRNAPRLRLMHNGLTSDNHFLALQLAGDGKTTSRDAIGARVEVVLGETSDKSQETEKRASGSRLLTLDSRPLIKTLRAGEGFLAQSSKWLHFGLGASDKIEKVLVRWPGGATEAFTGIEVDARYRLVQGSRAAVNVPRRTGPVQLVSSVQAVRLPSSTARIPMVELLTVPKSSYVDSEGRQRTLPPDRDGPVLINLWSRTCAPCLKEFNEFSQRYDEIRAAGIEILALSIDQLAQKPSAGDYVAKAVFNFKHRIPFPLGNATAELIQDFQYLHDMQFALHHPLPLPTSFLLDRRGRLTVIYKGPLSVDQLLKDFTHSQRERLDRVVQAAPIAGRSIVHPHVHKTSINSGVNLRFLLADHLNRSGRTDQATAQYADALELRPETAEAHNNLGNARLAAGRPAEAIEHYQAAAKLRPDLFEVQVNWGNALQALGRAPESLARYEQAAQVKPDNAETYYNWGVALHKLERVGEAIGRFEEAVRLKPDYAKAHHNLGILYASQTRLNDAVRHFRKSVELDPGNKQFRENLHRVEKAHHDSQGSPQSSRK